MPVDMCAGLHVKWLLKLSDTNYSRNGMTVSHKTFQF